jgi:type II secretory pathway component PulF
MTLDDVLADPARREAFLDAGVTLIEGQVAAKRGLSGMAIKAGFSAVQAIRPGMVRAALAQLLPSFAPAVAPFVARGQASGDLAGLFAREACAVANALLSVTDARAARAEQPVLKRTYAALRSAAHAHTAEAVPDLGRLLARFLS